MTMGVSLFDILKSKDAEVFIKDAIYNGAVELGTNYGGWSFLGAACWLGKYDVIKIIINYIENAESPNSNISQSHTNIEHARVIKRRSILDSHDINGLTPLILAINGQHFEICRLLVESGADVNLQHQVTKRTPLLSAVELSNDKIVTYLIDNGADPNIPDNVCISPLYMAIKNKNETIIKQLIDADCNVDLGSQDHAPIFLATRIGHLNIVKMLCEANCYKQVQNKYGVTAVYEAALKGHTSVLSYLLEQGCSPNRCDMYDQSPLHMAVMTNKLHCTKLLIQAGANKKLRNHNGETVIDMALLFGHADILEYFMMEGMDIFPSTTSSSSSMNSKHMKNIDALFANEHMAALRILMRGCSRLPPLPMCSVLPVFRENTDLLKLFVVSGNPVLHDRILAAESYTCKETSDWLKQFHHNPRSLADLCRLTVRKSLGNKVLCKAEKLPLPTDLKHFITLKHL